MRPLNQLNLPQEVRDALLKAQRASDMLPDKIARHTEKAPRVDPTPQERWEQFKKDSPEAWRRLKESIGQMAEGWCAYCNGLPFAQVEHHWPKSPEGVNDNRGTPKKMFDALNMLPSCSICNSFEYKGSRMEWFGGTRPKLPNPAHQDPGPLFLYDLNIESGVRKGWMDPQESDITKEHHQSAAYAAQLLGLNTRKTLREERAKVLADYLLKLGLVLKFGADYQIASTHQSFGTMLIHSVRSNQKHLGILRFYMQQNCSQTEQLFKLVPGLEETINAWNPDFRAHDLDGAESANHARTHISG